MTNEVQSILDFWFGATVKENPLENAKKWFEKDPAFDREVVRLFQHLLEKPPSHFEPWHSTPRGSLAYVILHDQFPRHIFRGSGKAFSFDRDALTQAKSGLEAGHDLRLEDVERSFYYLPFQHSENLTDQRESLRLYTRLEKDAQANAKSFCIEALDYAKRHLEIIERFGRFPHRNEALGRTSTPEEVEFLKQPGSSF